MSIQVQQANKAYRQGKKTIEVLHGLNLELKKAESMAIVGQSGSGKSTLLALLAGLDRPDSGRVIIEGTDLGSLSEAEVTAYRGQNIGIVFQQFHLMPHLTAMENVGLPQVIAKHADWRDRATRLLTAVGLQDRMDHFPSELSGGECQRVAIARALVTEPALLLADEPTGNLDTKTAEAVMELFFQIVDELRVTVLMVTHNEKLAERCHFRGELREGRLWS